MQRRQIPRPIRLARLLALGLILVPALVAAQPNSQDEAVLGFYLVEAPVTCGRLATPPDCEDTERVRITGELTSYYAVLCVFNADTDKGIAGVSCGIDYDSSIEIFNWERCSSLDFPNGNWPASGSGNIITWAAETNCQQEEPGGFGSGVTAVAGILYLTAYDPGLLELVPNPSTGKLTVADCSAAETDMDPRFHAGSVGFSDDGLESDAKLPCGGKPITPASWGTIKDKYDN